MNVSKKEIFSFLRRNRKAAVGLFSVAFCSLIGVRTWHAVTTADLRVANVNGDAAGYVSVGKIASRDVPVRRQPIKPSAPREPVLKALKLKTVSGDTDGWIDAWSRPVMSVEAVYDDGSTKPVPATWSIQSLYPSETAFEEYVIEGCERASTCTLLLSHFHRNELRVEYEEVKATKQFLVDGVVGMSLSRQIPEFVDDIPEWASTSVEIVARMGIMGGYDDGRFGAADHMTNAQFATMLYRTVDFFEDEMRLQDHGCPGSLPEGMTKDHFAYEPFCHFIRNAWDISWGLRMNEPITRGQVATLLNDTVGEEYFWDSAVHFAELMKKYGAADAKLDSNDVIRAEATDVDSDPSLERATAFVIAEGIMGEDRKPFRPDDTLNRAEAAAIFARLLNFLSDADLYGHD